LVISVLNVWHLNANFIDRKKSLYSPKTSQCLS
jgi:hypothetical protein